MGSLIATIVFVSEVAWAGSALSTSDEWLELFNPTEAAVEIGGWSIEGAGTAPLIVPSGSVIGAGGTFLISNYPQDESRSSLAVMPDWVTPSISLSNSSLSLTLRDGSGAVIDRVGSASAAPAAGATGDVKASMERVLPPMDGSLTEAWVTATTSSGFDAGTAGYGTPGGVAWPEAASSTTPAEEDPPVTAPEPTEASPARGIDPRSQSAVRISEIYPAPKSGGEEWIELVNRSSQGEVLDGWVIEDAAGGHLSLSGLLAAWGRLVVPVKNYLGNNGDAILLLDDRRRAIDRVEFGKMKSDESLARIEHQDVFVITITPTRGEFNVITMREIPEAKPQSPPASPSLEGEVPKTPPLETTGWQRPAPYGAGRGAIEVHSVKTVPSDVVHQTVVEKKQGSKKVAAAKPRYKGRTYEATVAVPTGVYGKTRFLAMVEEHLREVRLTKSLAAPIESGGHLRFVAQEKTDGRGSYLAVNANSVIVLDEMSEPDYAESAIWPETSGAYELAATVSGLDGKNISIRLDGRNGVVMLPASMAKPAVASGDEIRVKGFVSVATATPLVYLSDPQSLVLVKSYHEEKAAAAKPSKLSLPIALTLIFASVGIGILAYLRKERSDRLALSEKDALDELD
jgi:hypothetical protein